MERRATASPHSAALPMKNDRIMKILVTGSNGFIGHYVCKYMMEQRHYIISMGRSSKSKSEKDSYVCCDMGTDQLLHICEDNNLFILMQ